MTEPTSSDSSPHTVRITVPEQQHSTEEIIDRVEQDNERSITQSVLAAVFGDDTTSTKPYERIYHVYVPVFVAHVSFELERRIGEPKTEEVLVGVNAITGTAGQIDQLPELQERVVSAGAVINPMVDEAEARSSVQERIFSHVNTSYRSFEMPDYTFELKQHHFLYWLAGRGSLTNSYAINDLTGRRDEAEALSGVREYYRTVSTEHGE